MKAAALPALAVGLCLPLASCLSDDEGSTSRIQPRILWQQDLDSTTYAATRRMDVLVVHGSDTTYHQTLDFSLHAVTLPDLPRGEIFTLALTGFGSGGDTLWKGASSFTTTGSSMTLDVRIAAALTAWTGDSLELFGTWRFLDTLSYGIEASEKMVLSDDSTYMSYAWGVDIASGGRDTLFYAIERGDLAITTEVASSTQRSGRIRFNVESYLQCSSTTESNACGTATYAQHLTSVADTSVTGTWILLPDSLLLTLSDQTTRFHK